MNDRKRVLIISTMFPPRTGSGVQRVAGFVRYLPKFGWEPYVLTIEPGPYHLSGLPSKVPPNCPADRIVRTLFFDMRLAGKKFLLRLTGKRAPSTPAEAVRARATDERTGNLLWALANAFVFVPDPDIGWFPFGVRAGLSMIRSAGIHVILSSAPPFTGHLIALRLRRQTGIPWVADFRDPWSQNPYIGAGGFRALRHPIDKFLERKVMRFADAILSDTKPRAAAFAQVRVKGIEEKIRVIPNGYDLEDFAGMTHRSPATFTITYTGSFYGKARSPVPFLVALAELIEDGVIQRRRIRVRIIETFSQRTARLAARYGLSDVVTVRAGLSHAEALQEQVNASVLLLIVRDDPAGRVECPAKLFEYLGARRPILALGPKEGVAAELIREANAGVVVNPGDRQEIKEAIRKYYFEHEQTGAIAYRGRDEVIRGYERPVLTGRLARILDSLPTGLTTQTTQGPPGFRERGRKRLERRQGIRVVTSALLSPLIVSR